MLALYVPSSKIPEGLREFPSIINEKPLQPLAFIPPSEEEQVGSRILFELHSVKRKERVGAHFERIKDFYLLDNFTG